MKTPIKLWTGKKPDFNGLRVFGSLVYSRFPQGKQDPRAEKCIMIGYSDNVKALEIQDDKAQGDSIEYSIANGRPRRQVNVSTKYKIDSDISTFVFNVVVMEYDGTHLLH